MSETPEKGKALSRRSFLTAMSVGGAAMAVAACAAPAAPQAPAATQEEAPAAEAPAAPTEAPAEAAPVAATKVLNHMARHDFEAQRGAVEEWNQTHETQVKMDEVVGDTWDYYRIKMMQQLAAGNPPDTVFTDVWYFRLYAEDDIYLNLEELIAADSEFKKDDLWEVCVNNCTSPDTNGEMYVLPYDYGTHVLAYNKEMFEAEGVPALDPAKEYSWEADILPLATQFTKDFDGNTPENSNFDPLRINQYGINPYSYLFWWFVTQWGGQCFNADYTKSTMGSPEGIAGIQFLYDLMNKYKVAPSPAYQQSQPISFATGKIAMSIVATWDLPGITPQADFEWDIVAPPRSSVKIGDGRVSGQAILSTTAMKEDAWEWIKWLSVGNGQNYKQAGGGAIHPVKAKARNDTFMNRTEPPYNMEAFVKEAELGGGPPLWSQWHYYIDMAPAELQRAYVDEISVEEAVQSVDEKTDYLIANGKLP
jgi:multiple sugar transport system substrate-binding protein